MTAVVGNEDGAHKITADLMQGLDDIGFTIPAQGGTYWNDEAMGSRDYNDLDETPEAVASTTATLAANAAHLARLLKADPYPARLNRSPGAAQAARAAASSVSGRTAGAALAARRLRRTRPPAAEQREHDDDGAVDLRRPRQTEAADRDPGGDRRDAERQVADDEDGWRAARRAAPGAHSAGDRGHRAEEGRAEPEPGDDRGDEEQRQRAGEQRADGAGDADGEDQRAPHHGPLRGGAAHGAASRAGRCR